MGALSRAVRNVSRRKMRALLVIIALGFSMAIMISIPAGIWANQQATQTLTENFNSTISAMAQEINTTATLIECSAASAASNRTYYYGPPGGTPSFMPEQQQTYINETISDEIDTGIEGVKDVVPFIDVASEETTSETINFRGGSFPISRPLYTITGVSLNSTFIDNYSILPTNITTGSRELCEGDSGVLLMSSSLCDYLGVTVNDKVEVYGEYFTIVGIYEPTGQGSIQTRAVYMNISDAQRITGNTGNVSRLDVYIEDASKADAIASDISTLFGLSVTTYTDRMQRLQSMETQSQDTLNTAESTLGQTQTIATQEIIVAVVATSLIVLFVMLYTVRERTKEIGTLKAIGFSSWNVMSQFMLEGMLISLMAGVVGIAIGSVGAPFLTSFLLPHIPLFGGSTAGRYQIRFESANPGATVSPAVTASLSPQLMLLAFGVAVFLGALGSLYPAWRAARIKPAEAMRYE